jgi:hypothetical protein
VTVAHMTGSLWQVASVLLSNRAPLSGNR